MLARLVRYIVRVAVSEISQLAHDEQEPSVSRCDYEDRDGVCTLHAEHSGVHLCEPTGASHGGEESQEAGPH